MPSIDPGRVFADLRRLAEFGRYKTGVHRPTYSPQDVEARAWIASRMREAGLDPVTDGIGNVIGRSPVDGPRLLIGSHSESQNHAGWLDGALGVVYGLEAARALGEDPACAGLAIDVVSFADEEGHYGSFLGSRSFCGLLDEAEIDASSTATTARRCAPRWSGPAMPAARASRSIPPATWASSRRTSSRETIWKAPGCASGS